MTVELIFFLYRSIHKYFFLYFSIKYVKKTFQYLYFKNKGKVLRGRLAIYGIPAAFFVPLWIIITYEHNMYTKSCDCWPPRNIRFHLDFIANCTRFKHSIIYVIKIFDHHAYQGDEECTDRVMISTVQKPEEHCQLQPQQHCRLITKLVIIKS